MAILYKTDGTQEIVKPKSQFFSLEELQESVEGYIELIRLPDGRNMYINEDGKMKNLQPNVVATSLVDNLLFEGDFIVGNAIVLEKDEEEDCD